MASAGSSSELLGLSIFENYLFAMSRVFLKNLGKKGRVE
jgi:hypothetical protein